MDFNILFENIILDLQANNEDCIHKIEENGVLIRDNLDDNNETINKFIKQINSIIQDNENFVLIERTLKHKYFTKVYNVFKNSEVLIEACKNENINSIKWLLTMNINSCIQNEEGISALMYSSKNPSLLFVVENLISDVECLNLVDNNKENAFFYAIQNEKALNLLLKTNININQINKNGDTPLLYCCKNDLFNSFNLLINRKDIDVNVIDNEEKTPAIYLGAKARKNEFFALNRHNCDYNYKNKKNESALSSIVTRMYAPNGTCGAFILYIRMLIGLIHLGCDFNIPIDEIENRAVMLFIIARDYYMLVYILKYCDTIDLSLKNKYGENASSLIIKCSNSKAIYKIIKVHPTFDFDYVDQRNNNTLLMICSITEPKFIEKVLDNCPNIIDVVNNRNENALIIATKFECLKSVEILLKRKINVNQQDNKGNTALFYAVKLQNISLIRLLCNNNADENIKNNKDLSAFDLANELSNKKIINFLHRSYTSSSLSSLSSLSSISSLSSVNRSKDKLTKILSKIKGDKKENDSPINESCFIKTTNSNIDYKDMLEYLYPKVGNQYSGHKITKKHIYVEKDAFKDFFSNMEIKNSLDFYDPVNGFSYSKCLMKLSNVALDFLV